MVRKLFFALLLVGVFWLSGLAVYMGFVMRLQPYQGEAEGIVVLTGGDGRVETGLKLLDRHKAERLLVSGVHPDVKLKELLMMYRGDTKLSSRVDLGFAAQDTLGNADETALWVQRNHLQSLIVVTSHYHMPRALVHLGSQLPDVAIYPYPVVPRLFMHEGWYTDPMVVRLVIRDYNKFLGTYPQILFLGRQNI